MTAIRWRDAAKEMPPEGQDVLLWLPGWNRFEVRHLKWRHATIVGGGYRDDAMWYPGGSSLTGVFWMPLPAAPTAKPEPSTGLDERECNGDCAEAEMFRQRDRMAGWY